MGSAENLGLGLQSLAGKRILKRQASEAFPMFTFWLIGLYLQKQATYWKGPPKAGRTSLILQNSTPMPSLKLTWNTQEGAVRITVIKKRALCASTPRIGLPNQLLDHLASTWLEQIVSVQFRSKRHITKTTVISRQGLYGVPFYFLGWKCEVN